MINNCFVPGKKWTFSTEVTKTPEKDSSEKTEATIADEIKEGIPDKITIPVTQPTPVIFATTSSRLFDAYGDKRSPSPVRSRL